jgi:hypothetical protein
VPLCVQLIDCFAERRPDNTVAVCVTNAAHVRVRHSRVIVPTDQPVPHLLSTCPQAVRLALRGDAELKADMENGLIKLELSAPRVRH